MLRNVFYAICLTTITIGLPLTARAQTTLTAAGRAVKPLASENQPGMTAPALFEVAQNKPTNLADRLKAIRGNVASEYSTSSRRTANRSSAAPAAPAPLAESPAETESGEATAAPNLPSVLVRRDQSERAAPVTDAPQPQPSESSATESPGNLGTAFGSTEHEPESSRRTARRWRAQEPAYSGSSTFQGSSAFQTGSSNSSAGQLSLEAQAPSLRIETVGPQSISVGKDATYRVRLINTGSAAAQGVMVSVSLPGSAQINAAQARIGSVDQQTDSAGGHRIVWSLDQVPGSSQQELSINLKATENRPLGLRVDWAYRPASLAAEIEVQQPQLAVDIDGPMEMRFGETKVFKVKLSNPGNGPAENVSVHIEATGASGQPNNIGSLAAGESRTLELELTANQAGAMRIQALARGDGDLQARAAHDIRVRRAALAVKVSAPPLLYAGTTASYQIQVSNQGDAVAEDVIMQIALPAGAKNAMGVDKKPITIEQPRWRLGDLSPGSQRTYSMQCDLVSSGQNQLVATVRTTHAQGAEDLVASDTGTTNVEAIADLKLIVNDPKGPVQVGTDVTYEIQVINRGSKEAIMCHSSRSFPKGLNRRRRPVISRRSFPARSSSSPLNRSAREKKST